MSSSGHMSEGNFASRVFPRIKNRLRSKRFSRVLAIGFAGSLVAGHSLVPSAAHASSAKLWIEAPADTPVVTVKGAYFPQTGTAALKTILGHSQHKHYVQVNDGRFNVSFSREGLGLDGKNIRVIAWLKGHRAVAKAKVGELQSSPEVRNIGLPLNHLAAPSPLPASADENARRGGPPPGYELVWRDEFNFFDPTRWGKYEGPGNAGIGKRVLSAVNALGGSLKLTGNQWDGGGVGSSYKGTYGYYEIRAKFDKASVGYNIAAILWPASGKWPEEGEIDIVEIFDGDTSEAGSYVHWGPDNKQLYNEYKGDFSKWHTWGVDWQRDHITYYLDGKEFWKITKPEAIPHTPHFVALQLDVAPNAKKRNGSTYHIDYVRVYQKR